MPKFGDEMREVRCAERVEGNVGISIWQRRPLGHLEIDMDAVFQELRFEQPSTEGIYLVSGPYYVNSSYEIS